MKTAKIRKVAYMVDTMCALIVHHSDLSDEQLEFEYYSASEDSAAGFKLVLRDIVITDISDSELCVVCGTIVKKEAWQI